MPDETTRERDAAAVADRLHSAAIHLLRMVRGADAGSGLSPARLSALSVLVFGGPRTVGELATAEGVRSPTMSGLVAGLEENALVLRRHSAQDRRSTVVEATDAGRAVLFEARRQRVASLADRMAGLAPGDLAALDRAAALVERLVVEDA